MFKKLRILIIILICLTNLKAENLQLNLVDFAIQASEINKINILIDDSLKNNNFVFIINDEQDYMLEAFRKAVNFEPTTYNVFKF